MAIQTFVTNKSAAIYNANANPRGTVSFGTVLECDWLWDSGALKGMRRIDAPPDYKDRFIKDIDLDPYEGPEPPTEPGGKIVGVLVTYDDGSTQEFVEKDA